MRSNRIAVIVLLVALGASACHKKPRIVAVALPPAPAPVAPEPEPPPPPPPAPEPPPPPAPDPVLVALDQANHAFAAGNYDEAAKGYESYLRATVSGAQRDQALFRLALTYALRPAPATDWQRASTMLKQMVEEFPDSPFKAPATLILMLRSEADQLTNEAKQRDQRIKQLTTELDRLKKIDADRRKRP